MAESEEEHSLVRLTERERKSGIALLTILALAHLVFPAASIDLTLIGLLAGALFLRYFDIESVTFMGVKARRRELETAAAAVEQSKLPSGTAAPALPPSLEVIKASAKAGGSSSASATARVIDVAEDEEIPPSQPLERLLWVYEMVRRELTIIAGNAGRLDRRQALTTYPTRALAAAVRETGLLPAELGAGIDALTRARNDAAHFTTDLRLVEPAGNLGLEILTKLRQIRRNYIRVRHTDVALFEDAGLSRERTDRGVMVVQLKPDGSIEHTQVFPCRSDYTLGAFTTWEWDFAGSVRGQTWYRDPASGKSVSAFTESAFFAGREYPTEWHLERRFSNPDVGLSGSARRTA